MSGIGYVVVATMRSEPFEMDPRLLEAAREGAAREGAVLVSDEPVDTDYLTPGGNLPDPDGSIRFVKWAMRRQA